MYKKYEILKLLVSFCRFVNLQKWERKHLLEKDNEKQSKNLKLDREALKTKQKQLKLQDKGNKPKRACPSFILSGL
jgi:hypothetical protein